MLLIQNIVQFLHPVRKQTICFVFLLVKNICFDSLLPDVAYKECKAVQSSRKKSEKVVCYT